MTWPPLLRRFHTCSSAAAEGGESTATRIPTATAIELATRSGRNLGRNDVLTASRIGDVVRPHGEPREVRGAERGGECDVHGISAAGHEQAPDAGVIVA